MLFQGWTAHRPCPVYSRYDLEPGMRVKGPAVVEEDESTTVIGRGGSLAVDKFGNLLVAVSGPRSPS